MQKPKKGYFYKGWKKTVPELKRSLTEIFLMFVRLVLCYYEQLKLFSELVYLWTCHAPIYINNLVISSSKYFFSTIIVAETEAFCGASAVLGHNHRYFYREVTVSLCWSRALRYFFIAPVFYFGPSVQYTTRYCLSKDGSSKMDLKLIQMDSQR